LIYNSFKDSLWLTMCFNSGFIDMMKTVIGLVYFLLILNSFTYAQESACKVQTSVVDCDTVPVLNQSVIEIVKTKIGKKVATGECWDLAAEALNTVKASWDKRYVFGKEVNPETDCIYPGDIIQFEGVQVEYSKNGGQFIESMEHHTAIIYKVNGKGNYELAHQNFGKAGRKVGISNLELKNITKGKFTIYRPIK
jgi:hypothetical protein